MSLALLVWVGGGLLKRVIYFFGNEPSLGRKSPMLHLPLITAVHAVLFLVMDELICDNMST